MEEVATPLPARALRPGTRLGRYTIGQRIGCGGMAELYLASAEGMGGFSKILAMKVVHAHLASQPTAVRAFLREGRLAAALDHPNIVQVLDIGVMGGEHVLVMEYVHGRDLANILAALPEGHTLPVPLILRIALDVCAALEYAHAKCDARGHPLGVVHRDVSPANILVSFAGQVKLADFGIAKVAALPSTTNTGTLKGKFGYMSPEQSMGQRVDPRSDVFSLGVVLYELSTGRRAFFGENAFAIINKVIDGEYTPPAALVEGYPAQLAEIVHRALQPDAEHRYPSVAHMRADLDAFAREHAVADARAVEAFMTSFFGHTPYPDVSAGHSSVAAPTMPETSQPRGPVGRRWRRGVGIAAIALSVGLAVGWSVRAPDGNPPPPGDEPRAATQATPALAAPTKAAAVSPTPTPAVVPPPPTAAPAGVRPAPATPTKTAELGGVPTLTDAAKQPTRTEPAGTQPAPGDRRAKRARPRRRKKARGGSKRASDDLNAMFPESMK